MTSEHTLRQLESEMTRVRERLSTYERELQRVDEEHSERENFITSQLGELFQHEEKQRGLEAEMQEAQSSLEVLRQHRDEAAQLASEVRANVATLEERRRGAMLAVQRIEAMLSEVSAHLAKLKAQLESAIAEKQQREAENVRLAEQVIEWTAEREVAQQSRSRTAGRIAGRACSHCRAGRGAEVGARGAGCGPRSPWRTLRRAGARAVRRRSTWRRLAFRN